MSACTPAPSPTSGPRTSARIRPQESGNRTDVRWAALTGRDGTGLLVTGDALLAVTASHFTPEDLSVGARHDYQLSPREEVVLRVNHRQMGVGGDNSWGAQTHDEYKLLADRDYAYSYRLRPLTDVDGARCGCPGARRRRDSPDPARRPGRHRSRSAARAARGRGKGRPPGDLVIEAGAGSQLMPGATEPSMT
ncbi:hypothetical protein GCM10010129_76600 [Streptomyces fumigatiscleroticus]|nr:hypothetical protein GCM10010129_76600 [Streptomyces fumigatiscleroticus]